MPADFAIIAAVQWVVSAGGSVSVSATTRSATSEPSGGTRDGRVLSRRSPSTPSLMNRACQRQTQGFDLPVRRMIPAVPKPSAVARMMPARHTCFCGLFRSATTASNRARSAALTSTMIPLRIRRDSHRPTALGILRQVLSTSFRSSRSHPNFPDLVHADLRHRYAPFGQRTHRLRLSRVAALFPTKGMDTRGEVLAGLKLRTLERRGNFRPNRKRRGSPEQRRSAVQSPERARRAVSEVRMVGAKPFENTTFSAPRWAPVRVRNKDDGGGTGTAVEYSLGRKALILHDL